MKPLTTHEIGSLAKPSWRVKGMGETPLNDADIAEAALWGDRLHIPEKKELLHLLSKKEHFTVEEKEKIFFFSSLYAIKFLESSGLDLVWDGEQHRVEMYEYPITHMSGFHFHGHVRSFDNKYYRKASCDSPPKFATPYHLNEYKHILQLATKEIKIPITGPYTLADWSYDSYYLKELTPGTPDIRTKKKEARRLFMRDLAKDVIHPNLKALHDAGAKFIQIDEPAASTKTEETDLFIEAIKDCIGPLAGKLFFSVHICYSVYSRLFPAIQQLENYVNEIHLEYANRDSRELGTKRASRTGYEVLDLLKNTKFTVGLGVVDIHSDFIEPPELIRDRILYACDVIQDPLRIMVAPDCGLRTRTWDVAYKKLTNMVKGRNLALREVGREQR